ncbi:MAG: BamA/TamA family outer membrane protein [Magnetococcus sp. YQC-9]
MRILLCILSIININPLFAEYSEKSSETKAEYSTELPAEKAEHSEKLPDEKTEYLARLIGLEAQPEIDAAARRLLLTFRHQEEPPATRTLLIRRLAQDRKKLLDLLKSKGYFDAEVTADLDETPALPEAIFNVNLRERYHLRRPAQVIDPPEARFQPPSWEKLGLTEGHPAESAPILRAGEALVVAAREQGFPQARLVRQRVSRDPESHTIQVNFHLSTGPRARLGEVIMTPIEGVDIFFLKRRVPWNRGVVYHPQRLEETRKAFTGTGLFGVVRVKLADQPDDRGLWPVEVELKERKQRTWRAGAGFSTDRGAELNGGWEHRNFLGAGEKFKTDLKLGVGTLTLANSLDIPDYGLRGQNLKFSGKLDRAIEEAYENLALELGAGLVRKVFAPGGEGSLTLHYRLSEVNDLSKEDKTTHGLMSLPLAVNLDRSNDPLDATTGWRLATEIAPYWAITGQSVQFLRFNNKTSRYHTFENEPRLVLAGRAELDLTLGAEQDEIPVDNRLYAGGGSSVRGYGQQMAGPLDDSGRPVGGRSLLAFGGEARYRLTDEIGGVVFFDAGRAYTSTVPDFRQELLYGAGAGARYLTPIGPLRLDVGVPLRRRGAMDASWQIYLSIGQAF